MGLVDLKDEPQLTLADGIRAKVITGATLTVTHVELDEGAILPEHTHPHEQIVNVMGGELELTVEGTEHVLTSGMSLILEPDIPHSGRALKDTLVIDVFQPVREDFAKAVAVAKSNH